MLDYMNNRFIKWIKGDVPLHYEKANQMCSDAQFIFHDTLSPYLIRGVSYSQKDPTYSIVRRNDKANHIYLFQATYIGEFYVPGERQKLHSAPIVILLERKPEKVISCASIGGDGIMRGIDLSETWIR